MIFDEVKVDRDVAALRGEEGFVFDHWAVQIAQAGTIVVVAAWDDGFFAWDFVGADDAIVHWASARTASLVSVRERKSKKLARVLIITLNEEVGLVQQMLQRARESRMREWGWEG
jgi:hypothetical protein